MKREELEALAEWLDERPQVGIAGDVLQSDSWESLHNEIPRLLAIWKAAEEVADLYWGNAVNKSAAENRIDKILALRAALKEPK